MRRHQHVRQFVERAARRPPLRLGSGGTLPPHVERGAAEVAVLERGVERVLVHYARPRDVDRQRARLRQGEAVGVDQSSRLQRQRAGDDDRVCALNA